MMQATLLTPSGSPVRVEIATTRRERQRGLAYRSSLEPGRGMLLAFEQPGFHAITMQGMSFSIDILWINRHKRILWSVQNAPLEMGPSAFHSEPSLYVLEIAAGEMQRLGLKLGDVLRF